MSKTKFAKNDVLFVEIKREDQYQLIIQSIAAGYHIDRVETPDFNIPGQLVFNTFLRKGAGFKIEKIILPNDHKSIDFIINHFKETIPGNLGTEPDGQLKIHFEEADEVPA